MPGKHVHWNKVAEEISPLPSPSFSTSTLPSSTGPATPPPLGSGSPYQRSPLPGLPTTAIMIHPFLGVGPDHFAWDLTTHFTKIIHPSAGFYDKLMDGPATQPPVKFMEVACNALPWRFTITPQKGRDYVSVADFFQGLYQHLRLNVNHIEYDQVKTVQQRLAIENAYKRRYKRIADLTEHENEKAKGLKRVDYLMEYVLFDGIACNMQAGQAQWLLNVARPVPAHLLASP